MKRAKIIAAVIAAILIVVVVLQNTQPVETRILVSTVTMPRAALLFVTFAVGYVLGLVTSGLVSRHRSAKEQK